jgi:hypothetical protein
MIMVLDGNSGSVSDPVFFPFLLYQFNFNYIQRLIVVKVSKWGDREEKCLK